MSDPTEKPLAFPRNVRNAEHSVVANEYTRSRRRQFRGIFKYKCGICDREQVPALLKGIDGSEHPYKCKKCKIFICPRCYETDVKDNKCPKCGGKVSRPVFGK